MRIIPAIDIIEGKCVRLSKGDYTTKKVYSEDPLEMAKAFEDAGLHYLHLVDLDGAKAQHIVNWKVLEKLSSNTTLKIDFGGGVKTDQDLQIAFNSGAKQITGGSIAIKNPEVFTSWIQQYGAEKIILGADAIEGNIAVSGWKESTDQDIEGFIASYVSAGIDYVISTDIAKDGMLDGPATDLYRSILQQVPEIKLIASGGVSSLEDLKELEKTGLEGAIVGKAIYENRISLNELSQINA